MRSFSSLPGWAATEIKTFAHRINKPNKPQISSSAKLKSQRNTDRYLLGKLQFKDSKCSSISPPEFRNTAREQSFNFESIDRNYLAEILSRKDWYLLLNHEFNAQRLSFNTQIVVSVLQSQENALCPLRFYVWLSDADASLAKVQSVRSALSNALYRKGPVLLSPELIRDIKNSGSRVNEDLLCALIGSWGRLGLAKYCSEVFEQVSYLGIRPSTRLYNAVIDGLVKANALDLAYLKFQQMEADNCFRDRFTYNILIHGVCRAGVLDEAIRLVKQMEGVGYTPNVFTYTILIDGYCNAKKVDDAFGLLKRMKTRNVMPNDATYRSLINGVFQSLSPHEAFELLSSWVKREMNLPKVVYDSIVYCLCNNSLPKQAATFFRITDKLGYVPDSPIANLAVTCLIKGLDLEETCLIYEYFAKCGVKVNLSASLMLIEALYLSRREDMGNLYLGWLLQEGMVKSVFAYNMVLNCFCKAEMMDKAIETLGVMTKSGILPNIVTFNTLMSGCCKNRDVVKAREVMLMIFDHGLKPDVFTFNSIINVLCQVNQMTDAFDCLQEMVAWGITPNVMTYNSLIHSCCVSGNVVKVAKLLGKMQSEGIHPDASTFNALIQMHCKVNKIDRAQRLLKRMLALGLCPDNFTYTAFINLFCESGRLPEAKALFTSMEDAKGCLPDAYMCNSLIDGLVKSGEFEEAQEVWLKYNAAGLHLKPLPFIS